MDILHMLDDESILLMDYDDLNKLCTMITLDNQIELEENGREGSSNRRNMC
jgi:hypothetical protein